jgi:hypothetical protein
VPRSRKQRQFTTATRHHGPVLEFTTAIETRSYGPVLELRRLDGKPGEVRGYASVFKVKDRLGSVIDPGALLSLVARISQEGAGP